MPNVFTIFNTYVDLVYLKETTLNFWKNSKFEKLNFLKCDGVGEVGTKFIKDLCNKKNGLEFSLKEDKEQYDFLINDKKIILRTSRLNLSKTFQHENLKQNCCDYFIFIDISPADIHLTILKNFDLTKTHPILNRKPHLRKNTNIFKLDFSYKKFETFIQEKITIRITEKTEIYEIENFLKNFL